MRCRSISCGLLVLLLWPTLSRAATLNWGWTWDKKAGTPDWVFRMAKTGADGQTSIETYPLTILSDAACKQIWGKGYDPKSSWCGTMSCPAPGAYSAMLQANNTSPPTKRAYTFGIAAPCKLIDYADAIPLGTTTPTTATAPTTTTPATTTTPTANRPPETSNPTFDELITGWHWYDPVPSASPTTPTPAQSPSTPTSPAPAQSPPVAAPQPATPPTTSTPPADSAQTPAPHTDTQPPTASSTPSTTPAPTTSPTPSTGAASQPDEDMPPVTSSPPPTSVPSPSSTPSESFEESLPIVSETAEPDTSMDTRPSHDETADDQPQDPIQAVRQAFRALRQELHRALQKLDAYYYAALKQAAQGKGDVDLWDLYIQTQRREDRLYARYQRQWRKLWALYQALLKEQGQEQGPPPWMQAPVAASR